MHIEVVFIHQDKLQNANILCQSFDTTGRSVGIYHKNLIFDRLVYDIGFTDGELKE